MWKLLVTMLIPALTCHDGSKILRLFLFYVRIGWNKGKMRAKTIS